MFFLKGSTANADVARIENWARENKMHFNELKSKAMIITRKPKLT